MGLFRTFAFVTGAASLQLQACATPQMGGPKFDLVNPLLATWAGRPGTLELRRTGDFVLRHGVTTKGNWSPAGHSQFETLSPQKETCAFTIDGDRLTIDGCFLAGEFFRVRG